LDPFDKPLINPNFLQADIDVAIMREAVKAARLFVTAPTWSDYVVAEVGEFSTAQTDAAIDEYVRNNSDTVDHVCGTVAMGNTTCTDRGCGALNPDLTVKGAIGLRVVDASAFVSV
jgi:choline dehydrogenase-like flavoprotein